MRCAEANRADPVLEIQIRALELKETLRLPFTKPLVFGRDASCDVVLPSPTVSRRHLVVALHEGTLHLRDQSSHGSRVNGTRVQGTSVRTGFPAQVELGPYSLALSLLWRAQRVAVETALGESEGGSDAAEREIDREGEGDAAEHDIAVRRRIRAQLLESLDLVALDRAKMNAEAMRPTVTDALARIARSMEAELPRGPALTQLLSELCDEVLGLGPLEPLLSDPKVSEIMVVDARTIYVERAGKLELSSAYFTDDTAARAVLERIVSPLGRRIDESAPIVDARLRDGSRVNAVIPPLALKGPAITIRKFPQKALDMARLVQGGSLTQEMATFLERAVRVRVNIVIAGGTGSGKTTLLNVLSAAIPEDERVVTIEDAAELQLVQRHVVSLESRPPNMEGQGAVTIRDLVKNALRMRPDRIVVGECRGGEALDMLQAMNTGHDGSMTTTHANSPKEAVQRLETLCLMAGLDLPLSAIRRQIASSVNLIVQQARFSDGSRRVTHISEVAGMRDDGEVEIRDIFRFVPQATEGNGRVIGEFVATGAIPSFVDRFLTAGVSEAGAW
jgi:pilus assembly protein CpaF